MKGKNNNEEKMKKIRDFKKQVSGKGLFFIDKKVKRVIRPKGEEVVMSLSIELKRKHIDKILIID